MQIKGIEKWFFLHEDVRSTIATIANGRYMTGKTDDASIGRIGIVGLLWEVRRFYAKKIADMKIITLGTKTSSDCNYYVLTYIYDAPFGRNPSISKGTFWGWTILLNVIKPFLVMTSQKRLLCGTLFSPPHVTFSVF